MLLDHTLQWIHALALVVIVGAFGLLGICLMMIEIYREMIRQMVGGKEKK